MPEETPITPTTGDTIRMLHVEQMTNYVKAMAPGRPITEDEGAMNQFVFWSVIRAILNMTGPDFVQSYAWLLSFVNEHRRTVFSEEYVYRFLRNSRIQGTDRQRFERVVNLLLSTCNPATRRIGLKQINLPTTLRDWDGSISDKVIEFYSL